MNNVALFPLTRPTVATEGADRQAIADDLQLVGDVLGGAPALQANCGCYLLQYESEGREEYSRRVRSAPFRAEFRDALVGLASKPFSRPVALPDDAPETIVEFARDVDMQGSDLNAFARRLFVDVLAYGSGLILADRPAIETKTIADEKRLGVRSFWAYYPAASVIACRTERRGGREQIVHLRLREFVTEPDGEFGEKTVEQVRLIEPGLWQVWRRKQNAIAGVADQWEIHEEGSSALSANGVSAVMFRLGERVGSLAKPPLVDLARLNIELWRALSLENEIMTYSASPMLSANGVSAEDCKNIRVGPKQLLIAPAAADGKFGSWSYVSPNSRILREVRQHIKDVQNDIKRLGMSPLVDRNGLVTATESSIASSKASSVLEAWALGLKSCLENALALTIESFNQLDKAAVGNWAPTVDVFHDFGADTQVLGEATALLAAEKQQIISKSTVRDEFARRGLLGPDFDLESDDAELGKDVVNVE